jgi:hypothetical protein
MLFTLECSPGSYHRRTATLRNCIVRRYSRSGWQLYKLYAITYPHTRTAFHCGVGMQGPETSRLLFSSRRYPSEHLTFEMTVSTPMPKCNQ